MKRRLSDHGRDGRPLRPAPSYADRLRALWADIHTERPPEHARDIGVYREKRALTREEWAFVLEAIRSGMPATIVGHGWFSGIALAVYEPHVPVYPGVPAEPECVLLVAYNQVPGNDPNANGAYQKVPLGVERDQHGSVWRLFSAVVGTPENLAALDREKLPRPKGRGAYQY